MNFISYNAGYKYQLRDDYIALVSIFPKSEIVTRFIELEPCGRLLIRVGYAWDGPSGPTFDTLNFMRGSLVHDALYQLMREGHLDHDTHREAADRELQRICREDGMSAIRAWLVYHGVRLGGGPAANPRLVEKPIYAPREPALL